MNISRKEHGFFHQIKEFLNGASKTIFSEVTLRLFVSNFFLSSSLHTINPSCHWSLCTPAENTRESEVFSCFQEISGMKCINDEGVSFYMIYKDLHPLAITFLKITTETPEQRVKFVQSSETVSWRCYIKKVFLEIS